MTKIAVFGGKGRIGSAAVEMLRDEGRHATPFDVQDYTAATFDEYDVYLAAVPFAACTDIAYEASIRPGKLYLDLTEDVEAGREIRQLSDNGSIYVPHCGVAPGAVSIIANELLPAAKLTMRVGALPVHPTGRLKYALNWSTDGLVNEYVKTPFGIRKGRITALEPMGDYTVIATPFERFAGLEAFNTSGGIGTFADTRVGSVGDASYQTMRWLGHHEHMKLLLDDLGFKYHPDELVTLLDTWLPRGTDDLVEIQIYADGTGYKRTVYGDARFTAIQRTTAAGVVAVLLWLLDHPGAKDSLVRDGNWIANEDIPLEGVEQYHCWRAAYGTFLRGGYDTIQ
jgi:saccharopine dehydrogenase-like NADP-dependent oxidoreductase